MPSFKSTLIHITFEILGAFEGVDWVPAGHARHVLPQHFNTIDACAKTVPTCDSKTPYRSITGTCNNLNHPLWGSANIGMRRLLPPEYSDGVGSPRQSDLLPLARVVSTRFHLDLDVPSQKVTLMLTQFGQFLDHDITLTPEIHVEECCLYPSLADCFVMTLPPTDPFYSTLSTKQSCLQFSRSVAYSEKNNGAREQKNAITAYIDASNVYGSDEATSKLLRSYSNGKLRVNEDYKKELLPKSLEDGNKIMVSESLLGCN